MSKKTNTLWFVLGATIFNMAVTVLCFIGLLLLYARLLAPLLPEDKAPWGFPLIFIGSVALSFAIYRVILKLFMRRISVEKHFAPIFGGKSRKTEMEDQ